MTRIVIAITLFAGLAIASFQFYGIEKDTSGLEDKAAILRSEADVINEENKNIGEKIQYLGQADNLIKELKTKFNYRLPEERTIIVAPKENQ